jgi:hypothetical protein
MDRVVPDVLAAEQDDVATTLVRIEQKGHGQTRLSADRMSLLELVDVLTGPRVKPSECV